MTMHMSLPPFTFWPKTLELLARACIASPTVFCLAISVSLSLPAAAQGSSPTLDRIKAAYVYNFAKFVELPGLEDMPIRLCVVGKDDPNGRMLSLHKRVAQKREILVRKDVSLEQIKDCSMVFVGAADNRFLPSVVKQLGNAPVLLISDDRQAVDQGAHLVLLHNDDRVEFEVNLLSLQRSNLRASSQMLKLARTVVR
jgi:hypothetical protein